MLLPIHQPFDLHSTLFSGQAFRWRPNGDWSEGIVFNNVVRLRHVEGGIEFLSAPDDEAALESLIRDYLGLDRDIEGVYGSLELDDRLTASIARYKGMRILRQDPWECLVSFLMAQASNIPRITKNVEDICKTFGRPIEVSARAEPFGGAQDRPVEARPHGFPTPSELARATVDALWDLRLGYRARFISAAAQAVDSGKVDLMALREDPYEAALDTLMSLDGVGDKVANCVLLFSLDKMEAFPVDVWIERALQEWYLNGKGQKLTRPKMRLWAHDYFGVYAGYANHYLFHDRRLQGKTSS